jgi:hypothetical protein
MAHPGLSGLRVPIIGGQGQPWLETMGWPLPESL